MKKFTIFLLTFLLFVGFSNVYAQNPRTADSGGGQTRAGIGLAPAMQSGIICDNGGSNTTNIYFVVETDDHFFGPLIDPTIWWSTDGVTYTSETVPTVVVAGPMFWLEFNAAGTMYFYAEVTVDGNYFTTQADPFEITVLPMPEVILTPNPILGIVCDDGDVEVSFSVVWNGNSAGVPISYAWGIDGTYDAVEGPENYVTGGIGPIPHTYENLPIGTYTFNLSLQPLSADNTCWLDTAFISFTVVEHPDALLAPDVTAICETDEVNLTASTNFTNPQSYYVTYTLLLEDEEFGTPFTTDLVEDGDPVSSHVFTVGGDELEYGPNQFGLQVTITNEDGTVSNCVGELPRPITVVVYEVPTPADAGTDQVVCFNENQGTFTITANDPEVGIGEWSVLTDLGENATITDVDEYETTVELTPGDTVYLAWTITNGVCDPSVDTVMIVSLENPTVYIGEDTYACEGVELIIESDVSYNVTPYSYTLEWTTGGGITGEPGDGVEYGEDVFIVDPTPAGATGAVYLTVTDENGCVTTDTVEVIIRENPTVYINDVDLSHLDYCEGDDVTLAAIADGGTGGPYTYIWSADGDVDGVQAGVDGEWYDLNTAIITPPDTLSGTIIVVVYDEFCSATAEIDITLWTLPWPADPGGDQTKCTEEDLSFTMAATEPDFGIATWIWDDEEFDTVEVSDIHDPNATVTGIPAGETVVFGWSIKNGPVCEAVVTNVSLTHRTLPIITFIDEPADGYKICLNEALTVYADVEANGSTFPGSFTFDWTCTFGGIANFDDWYFDVPSHTPGKGSITLTVTDDKTCEAQHTAEIWINPDPEITVEPVGTPLCNFSMVHLAATVSETLDEQSYNWMMETYDEYLSPIDVIDLDLHSLSEMYRLDLPDEVAYIIFALEVNTLGFECQRNGYTNLIEILPNIHILPVGATEDTVCIGGSTEVRFGISNYDINEPIYYQWLENNLLYKNGPVMTLPVGNDQIYMVTDPATHENEEGPESYCYSLKVWQGNPDQYADDHCYSYSDCFMLTVLKDPEVTISGPSQVYVGAPAQTFTANVVGGDGNASFVWYLDGEEVGENENTYILDDADILAHIGDHDIAVKVVQETSGCESDLVYHPFSVYYPDIQIYIEALDEACACSGITLTAVVLGDFPEYTLQWKYDGTPIMGATGHTLDFTLPCDAVDLVEFVVELSFGSCNVITAPIKYIQIIPKTVVWVDDYVICENGMVDVVVNSASWGNGEIYRFVWYDGDDNEIDITYEPHRYFIWGEFGFDMYNIATYKVKAEMLNAACESDVVEFHITIQGALEEVTIDQSDDVTCTNTMVLFSINEEEDPNVELYGVPTYTWWVDGIQVLGEALSYLNYSFAITGTHYVYARLVYPGNNCELITDEVTIIVNGINSVVIEGPAVVCGDNATLQAIVDPYGAIGTYQWYLGTTELGTEDTQAIDQEPSAIPYFYFVIFTEEESGCIAQSEPFEVKVIEYTTIGIVADNTKVCEGDEVMFTSSADYDENFTYQWYVNDEPIADAIYPILYIIPNNNDVYYFTAQENGTECVATSNAITITVVPIPEVAINVNVSDICEGAPVILEATAYPGGVYTWYKNGVVIEGAVSHKIVDFPQAQNGLVTPYTYTVQVTVEPGCTSPEMLQGVEVLVNPALELIVEGQNVVCEDKDIILNGFVLNYDILTGPLSYTWVIPSVTGVLADPSDYLEGFVEGYDTQYESLLEDGDGYVNNFKASHQVFEIDPNDLLSVVSTCASGSNEIFMYNLGKDDAATLGGGAGETAAQTYATQYIAAMLTAVEEQAEMDALADAAIAGPFINYAEGFDKGYAYANAIITDLYKANMIGAVPSFNLGSFTAGDAPAPIAGTFDPALYYLFGIPLPCPQGEISQNAAYSAGYRDGYWLSYRDAFLQEYFNLIVDGLTTLYTDKYVDVFGNNYEVVIDVIAEGSFIPGTAGEGMVLDINLPARPYPYCIYLTAHNENGCVTTSDPFCVTVVSAPEVEITADHDSVCPGTPVTLIAHVIEINPEAYEYQYRWYAEDLDHPITGAIYSTYTVIPQENGEYKYLVRVYNVASGCETVKEITIYVDGIDIIAETEVIEDVICLGEQVTFNATSNQADAVFTWYINGVKVAGADLDYLTYNFDQVGGFVIEVAASSLSFACLSQTVVAGNITVVAPIEVELTGPTFICNEAVDAHLYVQTSPSEDSLVFNWYLGGVEYEMNGDFILDISDLEPSSNPYEFSVVVIDTYSGCVTLSTVHLVYVGQFPVVAITADKLEVCPGNAVLLTAAVNNDPNMVYQWFADGEEIEDANAPVYYAYPEVTTVYTFTATQIGSECEAGSNEVEVVVIPSITIDIEPVTETICEGKSLTFTVPVIEEEPEATYTWWVGNQIVPGATLNTLTYTFDHFGVFTVKVSATTNIAGCTSDVILAGTITVKAAPTVHIEGATVVCNTNNPPSLLAVVYPTDAPVEYKWTIDDTEQIGVIGNSIPIVTVPRPNPYIYVVEITDTESGCNVKSDAHIVYVEQYPVIGIFADKTEVCAGETVKLEANVTYSTNVIYKWYKVLADGTLQGVDAGVNGPIINVNPLETTTYTFTATEIGSNCVATSNNVTVEVIPTPIIVITPITETICQYEQVTFTAELAVPVNVIYTWLINGQAQDGAITNIFTYNFNESGTFVVEVEATTVDAECTSSRVLAGTITVKFAPSVEISGVHYVCDAVNPADLKAVVSPWNPTITYQWYLLHNGEEIELGTNQTQPVTTEPSPYEYTYVVVITDYESGCQVVSEPHVVKVTQLNPVSITSDADRICVGQDLLLNGNINDFEEMLWQWYGNNNGNGEELIGEGYGQLIYSPIVGSWVFTLKGTQNVSGCTTSSFGITVIVDPIPEKPLLTVLDPTICTGGGVTIYGDNEDGKYNWYIDGILDEEHTLPSITEYPTANGNGIRIVEYIATVTVNDCESAPSDPVYVQVHPKLSVVIVGEDHVCTQAVGDEHLVLHALVTGKQAGVDYKYTWSYVQDNGPEVILFQAINNADYAIIPNDLPVNDGVVPYFFRVKVEAVDYGCSEYSDPHKVFILPQFEVFITVDKDAICVNGEIEATATVQPGEGDFVYNYTWKVNGVATKYTQIATLSGVFTEGINIIECVVERSSLNGAWEGACTGSATIPVTIFTAPELSLTQLIAGQAGLPGMCIGGEVEMCAPIVNFQGNTDNFNYEWKLNGSLLSDALYDCYSKVLPVAGNYIFEVRAFDESLGCNTQFIAFDPVKVVPQPTLEIATKDYILSEVCVGAILEIINTLGITDPNIQVGYQYNWVKNPENTYDWINFTNQIPPKVVEFNIPGTYTFQLEASFANPTCDNVTSNELAIKVVNDPVWTNLSIEPDVLEGACVGETVEVCAYFEGGVTDGTNIGTVQWSYNFNGGAFIDLTGVGNCKKHKPLEAGEYFYMATYIPSNSLSGCNISADAGGILGILGPMEINAAPTAMFVNEGVPTSCLSNPLGDPVELYIEFTGAAPFYFTIRDDKGTVWNLVSPTNFYTFVVKPTVTTKYTIESLSDFNKCDNSLFVKDEITVVVTDVKILTPFVASCDGVVNIDVLLNSYSIAEATIQFDCITIVAPIIGNVTHGTISFTMPDCVPWGPNVAVVTIDNCDYNVSIMNNNGGSGVDELIYIRWEGNADVLVVSNNYSDPTSPYYNGGMEFLTYQWYKNGNLIEGATMQYYQHFGEPGIYHVHITGYTVDANGNRLEYIEFVTCGFEVKANSSITVFPVPAQIDQPVWIKLNLTPAELDGAYLDIYDVKGAFVKHVDIESSDVKVEGFNTQGAYFGKITTGINEIKSVKFVIVK